MNMTDHTEASPGALAEDPLDRDYQRKNYLALGCGDVLLDVYQIFLESAPLKIEQMKVALGNVSQEQLVSLSHGLKGESGSVGARFVMATAAAVERAARSGELETAGSLLPQLEQQLQQVIEVIRQELAA